MGVFNTLFTRIKTEAYLRGGLLENARSSSVERESKSFIIITNCISTDIMQ